MNTSSLDSLGIVGASGRLGRRIVELARAAGLALPLLASRREGWSIERQPRVLVDVSHRSALREIAAYCEREGVPLVCATSDLGSEELRVLDTLAKRVAVVRAVNLSFGHYLQTEALAAIGRCLGKRAAAEVRVVDRHPRTKRDRPSSSALRLAELCQAHGGSVVIESLRHGLPVANHQVGWTFEGEELLLEHRVDDRVAAAHGALSAASWVTAHGAGLFEMADVYR